MAPLPNPITCQVEAAFRKTTKSLPSGCPADVVAASVTAAQLRSLRAKVTRRIVACIPVSQQLSRFWPT